MPRGRFNKAKPQSGLPGLLWRQRGGGGCWVVSLAVPRELQPRVVNRAGKPLARLERTTGTDSLKLAKELYPRLLSELKQELAERSATLEPRVIATQRVIGEIYQRYSGPAKREYFEEADLFTKELDQQIHTLSAGEQQEVYQMIERFLHKLTTAMFARAGLPIGEDEMPLIIASLTTAFLEARDFQIKRRNQGYFAEETELGKKMAAAASRPKVVSIFEVARLKKSQISERTYENLERTCKHWKAIIGEEALESITPSRLNFFVRTLNKLKADGGYGYCVENANNEGVRIRSLIKFHNEHQKEDSGRIPEPSWERIKESRAQQKERVRKDKDRATDKNEVKLLLDYAYTVHEDKYAWLYVFLLDNTTLRNSEALSLKWKHVVQRDGIWFIDLQDSKTVAGIRRLPLNSRLTKYMLPLKGADDEYVINNSWPHWKNPKDGSGNFLRQARKALGIGGRINAHAFRHGAGGDLGYTQTEHIKITLMGHAGKQTDQYSRREWLELRKAVEAIGTDWTPPSAFPPPPLEIRFDPDA